MIADFTQDLIDRVSAVPVLAGKVGTMISGTDLDPLMLQAPAPFAYIIFSGDDPVNGEQAGRKYQQVKLVFTVAVFQDYTDVTKLMTEVFPTLDAVAASVRGYIGTSTNLIWKYEGQRLTLRGQGRIVYEQQYSIIATLIS